MGIVLTNTAKYDPFTFQELAAPYMIVDKAAGEVMDIVDEYGAKADLMKKYADENPDSEYAQRYYAYSNELNKIASDMAKYGMSADLRNRSRGLKRRYSSDINPMEEADKLFKEQQKERLAHPERIYLKGLSFKDAYNNKIDNTYLTENDITKEAILNYSSGFNTSYSKWIDQGATPEQAIVQSRQENANTLTSMLEKLSQTGYDINDARIQKAIQTGMLGVEADIAKGELMTRKEREAQKQAEESLRIQRNKAAWDKKMVTAKLSSEGMKMDDEGRIVVDKESDYWKNIGVTEWTDKNEPVITLEDGTKLIKKGNLGYEQIKDGESSLITKSGKVITSSEDSYEQSITHNSANGNNKPAQEIIDGKTVFVGNPNVKDKKGNPLTVWILDESGWFNDPTVQQLGETTPGWSWFDVTHDSRTSGAKARLFEGTSLRRVTINALPEKYKELLIKKIKSRQQQEADIDWNDYNIYQNIENENEFEIQPKGNDMRLYGTEDQINIIENRVKSTKNIVNELTAP